MPANCLHRANIAGTRQPGVWRLASNRACLSGRTQDRGRTAALFNVELHRGYLHYPTTVIQRRHILAIDIGGSHVKLRVSNRRTIKTFDSSPSLEPRGLLREIRALVAGWSFDRVTLGFPGLVIDGRIVSEPANLGHGWVRFDFAKAFSRPVRIMNDAVMQALGGYTGGRMLFLGFGTALGAVAILDGRIHPMELVHLPFDKRELVQNSVGADALRRLGRKRWSINAKATIRHLRDFLEVDYVVLGGGNACRLGVLPKNVRLKDNELAFIGGFRAWQRSSGTRLKWPD